MFENEIKNTNLVLYSYGASTFAQHIAKSTDSNIRISLFAFSNNINAVKLNIIFVTQHFEGNTHSRR